jgi:hypothetical protein
MLHRWSLARSEPPVVLFELPDLERVLDEVAFWDIYYEHCSYFTESSLRFTFEHTGFDVLDVRRVYDGQYLVLDARAHTGKARTRPDPGDVSRELARAARFVERYRAITVQCRANLERLVDAGGHVVLWGGGAKAVSFLTSLDIGELVEFAVDVNPNKQGKFLVGAGHPVVGPGELRGIRSLHLVVMNPVYVDEIAQTVTSLGIDAHISTVNELLSGAPTFAE